MSPNVKKSALPGTKSRLKTLLLLLTLAPAAIPFSAGKYMELRRDGPFDGALNAYAAKAILDGARIGPDIMPSARPATLLVNIIGVAAFGYSELGPKLIQMIMQMAGLALLFVAMRRLFGALPAMVSLFLAAFFLSYPLFAKYGNVKEQFMIAAAMIAASCLLLNAVKPRWWLLLLAGAFAVNVHYFKPTGDSLWAAMAVYLLIRLCADPEYPAKMFGKQLGWLILGAVIGMMPLLILFGSQHQLGMLTSELPKPDVLKKIFKVSAPPAPAPVGENGSASSAAAPAFAAGPSSYLEAGRQSTDFPNQYEWVMQYFSVLIVPIGMGLTAVVLVILTCCRRTALAAETDKTDDDPVSPRHRLSIAWMLVIWWLLDMLFVWVSPRSYVEYFLPLNASAAALTALVLYRARRSRIALPILVLAWAGVYLFVNGLTPTGSFPYLAWQTIPALSGKKLFFYSVAILGVCLAWLAPSHRRRAWLYVQWPITGIVFLLWMTPVVKEFRDRVTELHHLRLQARQQAQQGRRGSFAALSPQMQSWRQAQILAMEEGQPHTWKIIGHFIALNTEVQDKIYVWGWFPGIYVAAQRLAPIREPAEAEMHNKPPAWLDNEIKAIMEQFEKNPPRFIVDSQKMHFPYYSNPVFDLWPRFVMQNNKAVGFDLRIQATAKNDNIQFIAPEQMADLLETLNDHVRQMTYTLLTSPQRKGGPLPAAEAQRKAELEAQRHRAMQPLRDFVMKYYRPVPLPGIEMFVFEYRAEKPVP